MQENRVKKDCHGFPQRAKILVIFSYKNRLLSKQDGPIETHTHPNAPVGTTAAAYQIRFMALGKEKKRMGRGMNLLL